MSANVARKQLQKAAWFVALGLGVFHLYTTIFGLLPYMQQRPLHLAGIAVIGFLFLPISKKKEDDSWLTIAIDAILIVCAIIPLVWHLIAYKDIAARGGIPKSFEIFFALLICLVIFELTRRSIGNILPVLAIIFVLYAYFGKYLPGIWAHRGMSVDRLTSIIYMGPQGIFGTPLGVAANVLIIFVIMGAFLEITGAGDWIVNLSYSIAGRFTGGAAKTAVIASGGIGTITGVAAANVVVTGTFTIPLMKKGGYSPHFAAGTEAAASAGGIIMPPVMGSVAFIMAELLELPYRTIIFAALAPAILYYSALLAATHFEAQKRGIGSISKDKLPRFFNTLKSGWFYACPIIIMVALIIKNYSPRYAALWAIITLTLIGVVDRKKKIGVKTIANAIAKGTITSIKLSATCACAGVIIACIHFSGLALRFSSIAVHLSMGIPFLLLIICHIVCIILGMGLPPAASYIIASMLAVPAIIQTFNIEPLVAHFFVMYFCAFAVITPPVCLTSYTAAGLAEADFVKTGLTGYMLASPGMLIPYVFVYGKILLAVNFNLLEYLIAFATGLIGVIFLAMALIGYFRIKLDIWQRVLLFAAAICTITPGFTGDILGIAIGLLVIGFQYRKERKNPIKDCLEGEAIEIS